LNDNPAVNAKTKESNKHSTAGIVIRSTGNLHQVRLPEGEIIECRIKGKLRIKGLRTTNPVAVGDSVQLHIDKDKTEVPGVITQINERKNCITRKSVNLSKHAHIIAANIDHAYLIATLAQPQTSTVFIDRFLVTAEASNLPVTIIFNKADIYDDVQTLQVEDLKWLYQSIGYECIVMSALNPDDINKLNQRLQNQVSLFSGHSGVGKSTLINAIEPGLDLKIGAISEQYGEGKHTTTFAEMFPLDIGGYIIDTPGIRGFGIVDIDMNVLSNYFPEMFALQSQCKFNNCQHFKEPQCAVRQALEQGQIAQSRYDSYESIFHADEEDQYRRNTRQ